jgi:hypothetical protein
MMLQDPANVRRDPQERFFEEFGEIQNKYDLLMI